MLSCVSTSFIVEMSIKKAENKRMVKRAYTIGLLDGVEHPNLTMREIARISGTSRSTCYEYRSHRPDLNEPLHRGAATTITEYSRRSVIRYVLASPRTKTEIYDHFTPMLSKHSVDSIINNALTDRELACHKRSTRLDLTEDHKRARLDFAINEGADLVTNNIVFTDEKKFTCRRLLPKRRVYHDPNLQLDPERHDHNNRQSIMVWGAIGHNFKSDLMVVPGTMDAVDYQNVLTHALINRIPEADREHLRFVQDNAAVHSAHTTLVFLRNHRINKVTWPSRSPDMNPIENLWAHMSRIVYRNNAHYANPEQLRTAVMNCWDAITQEEINNYVASFPQRLDEVARVNGDATRF